MAAGCPRYREMQGCRVLMNNPEAASVGGLVIFGCTPNASPHNALRPVPDPPQPLAIPK
jgi:hypothetical protein